MDVRETIRLLRGLQELDEELFRVRSELRRLPEERARRRAQLDSELQRLSELDARLRDLSAKVKEIEDLTTSQRRRIRKLEGEAAASRGDTALLVAFQHEIRSLRRQVSEEEEEGLGLVEERETVEAERAALRESIDREEEAFAEYEQNLAAETEAARRREAELAAERERRMGDALRPELLLQYEKLLEAREGQAMAALDGRVCQGCYVEVPQNVYVRLARGTELVSCPSCGRILYLP